MRHIIGFILCHLVAKYSSFTYILLLNKGEIAQEIVNSEITKQLMFLLTLKLLSIVNY